MKTYSSAWSAGKSVATLISLAGLTQAFSATDAFSPPTTVYIRRARTSFDDTASKFTYQGNYACFLSKYWDELAEPEPMRTADAKQRALASAPAASTYAAANAGEVEEYFAPDRYARYERSTVFVPAEKGSCTLTRVEQTTVQIAQQGRLINATTKNGITKVNEVPLRPAHLPSQQEAREAGKVVTQAARSWGGGFAPGRVSKIGEKRIADEDCDLMSSSLPVVGIAVEICVWRSIKVFLTPLGPREIVLFSEAKPPPGVQPMMVTDPININMADVLHWTENATEFRLNESFADKIFTAPRPAQ